VVGEGGFGVVYRGWHARLDVPIAIKVLKTPSHFGAEARAAMVERFQLEGKTLAKLSDDAAIVRVLDMGVTAPTHVVASQHDTIVPRRARPLRWNTSVRATRCIDICPAGTSCRRVDEVREGALAAIACFGEKRDGYRAFRDCRSRATR
jgi:hypothetical protein